MSSYFGIFFYSPPRLLLVVAAILCFLKTVSLDPYNISRYVSITLLGSCPGSMLSAIQEHHWFQRLVTDALVICHLCHLPVLPSPPPRALKHNRYKKGGKGSLVKCYKERIVQDYTEGSLQCPGCQQEFARPAMVHGKPAFKMIGGKVFQKK